MSAQVSLFHPAGRMSIGANPFGKDIANVGLFRALIAHGEFARVHVATQQPIAAAAVAAEVALPHGTVLTTGVLSDPDPMIQTGMLLRGQPDISELAWMRRRSGGDHLWSLAGLVHSIAPPATRALIADTAIAPVQPWDAVICTSPVVADALGEMFDGWNDYLQRRFGGANRPRPQLPVIPLGVDVDAFPAGPSFAGTRLRRELGIGTDDILVAWVGRLSFFEKAFPQPMFRAVGEAAAATDRKIRLVMAGWFPSGETDRKLYEQAALAYAGDVGVSFLDGNDQGRLKALWSAADIFLSLVDNVQETFGITPLEAMAAGLPVVVSDWDGYRANVRDGVDGFLVRTLGGASGAIGEMLATRHHLGMDSYHSYVGGVAQHTAVDVGAAAQALTRLAEDKDLRRRMGAAGRSHVRQVFDWPVIARSYAALFADLAAERRSAPADVLEARLDPVRADPFAAFRRFATTTLSPDTSLQLRGSDIHHDLARIYAVDLDRAFASLRASGAETELLLKRLKDRGVSRVDVLLADFPTDRQPFVQATLVWLAKLGILTWNAAPEPSPDG